MPLTARQRSIHNKNGVKRTTSLCKDKRKVTEGEFIVTSAPSELRAVAYPSRTVALLLLLVARLLSACYSHVADCDETYNYWEPLHYLVYGSGLQTWEYSPAFALRSYLPLWLLAAPGRALALALSPAGVFYALRAALAALGVAVDLMFYKAVCTWFGVHVGRVWLALALPAAGSFGAAASLVPSAWGGALAMAALACRWARPRGEWAGRAVLLVAAAALLAWPFLALLGLPVALDLLLRRRARALLGWAALGLLLFLAPAVLLDSWHYGRLVVAPWNIVLYNVFGEHGPSLYGVEPWTYYFVNGFLNFNVVWVLALSCPAALAACGLLLPGGTRRVAWAGPYWLDLLPLYLWLAVFQLQPHKEERFLYPVYRLVLLAAALALDAAQKLAYALWERAGRGGPRHYLAHTAPLAAGVLLLAALGGVARVAALYRNYHAPMTLLRHLPPLQGEGPQLVCFGKEWHRSPSSFHLPRGYEVRFVPSDFDGQMPAPFPAPFPHGTREAGAHFNSRNVGDNRTYVAPGACHYLVDSDVGAASPREPHYHRAGGWAEAARGPLLDAARSAPLARAVLLPGAPPRLATLYLLRNTRLLPPAPPAAPPTAA